MTIPYLKLVAASLVAFLFALAITPVAKTLLTRFGVVDLPSARRINKTPIPRGGGTAVVISFALTILFANYVLRLTDSFWNSDFTPYALAATALIVLVGFIDDIRGLAPVTKLIAQIAAACIVFAGDASFGHLILFAVPDWLDLLITIGWFVIIVNAFNLIDGLDGLAAGLAVIGSFGLATCLAFRGNPAALLTLAVLIGACLGFLRYNYNPASIFLGDTGSLFIGFILALAPLVAGGKSVFIASVGVPLLAVGLPIFDTILAILRRSARVLLGSSKGVREIVTPDVEHLHHRLLSSGMSQRHVARVLYLLAAILVLAAVTISVKNATSGAVILGLLLVLGILGRQLTRVELWYVGNALNNAVSSLPRKLLAIIYVALDIAILVAGWCASADLTLIPHIGLVGYHIVSYFSVFFACILASFMAFRIYRRDWGTSQGLDFFALILAVFIGWIAAYSLITTFYHPFLGFGRQTPVFLAVVCVPLIGVRALRVVVRALLAGARRDRGDTTRVVIFGSGIGFFVLFTLFKSRFGKAGGTVSIVAVVDDDPETFGGYVQGYRVTDAAELDAVVRTNRATAIVLAKNLPRKKLNALSDFAREHNLPLRRFTFSLKDVYTPSPPDVVVS